MDWPHKSFTYGSISITVFAPVVGLISALVLTVAASHISNMLASIATTVLFVFGLFLVFGYSVIGFFLIARAQSALDGLLDIFRVPEAAQERLWAALLGLVGLGFIFGIAAVVQAVFGL